MHQTETCWGMPAETITKAGDDDAPMNAPAPAGAVLTFWAAPWAGLSVIAIRSSARRG